MIEAMLDLETFGRGARAHVCQLAIVIFELEKPEITQKLFRNIQYQHMNERHLDDETLRWWMAQSHELRMGLNEPEPVELAQGIIDVQSFLLRYKPDRIWCRGPQFDIAILEDCFRSFNIPIPWAYNAGQDLRAYMKMAKVGKGDVVRDMNTTEHSALGDCMHQIECLRLCAQKLGGIS